MQRWTAISFLVLVLGSVALVWASKGAGKGTPSAGPAHSASGAPSAGASAGPVDAGAPAAESAAAEEPGSPGEPAGLPNVDAGATLLGGEAPPALPADAPKSVTFGVILVQYKGAQGAPAKARSREAALELAKQLAADAKTDFKAAVAKGDKGSNANVGKIQRNYLEPAPEYVLFSLAKDAVSDPVDTPRGFWIVKRID